VWRDRDTLQIGIDSRRAVALTGMGGIAWLIGLLDGSRDRAQVIQAAAHRGIPEEAAERVLALLAAAGALDDFPASTLRALSQPERARLAAELATVSLARGDGDGGARTLARRLAAQVRLHGGGRLEAGIASLLSASGVSRVTRADAAGQPPPSASPASTSHATRSPRTPKPATKPARALKPGATPTRAAKPDPALSGTLEDSQEPRPRESRPRPARSRAARAPVAPAGRERPDLAILTGRPVPEFQAELMRDDVPHLVASASEAIGVVGPLVLPGRTACLRCLDRTRADRDPAWPLILAQLVGREPDPLACDAPLAAAVAAQTVAQALAFIDRPAEAVAVYNGTLELVLPSWQWRRRTWLPHPDCDCGSQLPDR